MHTFESSIVCEREGALGSGEGAGGEATLVGAGTGPGSETEGVTGTGEGADAVNDLVGVESVGGEVGVGGTALAVGPEKTLPSAKLTSFLGAVFPLKNSEALKEGSMEGAGG